MVDVDVKMEDGYHVAYIRHVGPYNLVGPIFGEVFAWASEKGLSIGPMIGIYYDDPSEVSPEKRRSDICIVVGGEAVAEPDERVKLKVIPTTMVAYTVYEGPWEKYDIPGIYRSIGEWTFDNGYEVVGPPREIYHEFQTMERPEAKVLVEIQFPVRKT